MIPAANILTYLEMIPDPRKFRLKHRLIDVVAVAILSKICGAEGWEDMHEFAQSRKEWLDQKSQWKDLRSIVRVASMRQIGEKREQENRYYISSLPPNAEVLAKAIRGHWGVENACHWTLDVVFKEDESLVMEGNAPENLRAIHLLVAKMLKAEKTCKKGIRAKQFKASLNHEYLCSVLQAANF